MTAADAYNGTSNDGIYDGYFALGEDIDFNGTYDPPMILAESDMGNKELGFRGVFDGRGHSINGMRVECAKWGNTSYRWTGFISVLQKNGVIKNVAFTNASVQYNSFLASWGGGIIENVYVAYTGNSSNDWNCTVNNTRDSAPAITMRNCVISYDTAWTNGYILGKIDDTANVYRNVYIVGPEITSEKAGVACYFSNVQNKDGVVTDYPLGDDNIARYETVGAMLAERKNEISGWNYFTANETTLSFGSSQLLTASEVARDFTGNTLISADKTSTDYVIVYEDGNDYALNAAAFIAEHIKRASGNIVYTKGSGGRFSEEVTDGIVVSVMTELPAELTDTSAYIIVGKNDYRNSPVPNAGQFVVKTVGNTAFIRADLDMEYITAAIAFLKETIGYLALSDDIVTYENVGDGELTMPEIDMVYDSAFNVRNTTNAHHGWKNDQLGLNGRGYFSVGPKDDNGNMQLYHNSIYWLDYVTNKDTHPSWFRTTDNGVIDVCYSAGGTQDSSNSEYVAMVSTAAANIRSLLNAYPDVNELVFSLMDNDLIGCTCSNCSSNRTNAAVTFLNDVVAKIQEADGNTDRKFTIYMLAYYYLIDAPTINMNEHLGVIYAPIRNSREAKSIYDSSNNSVRTQISAWLDKTKNIGFWYYSTLFHNYMMYTDMTESLLTWFEYTARTCKAKGAEPIWFSINGQNRERNRSAFESFKQYAFANAEVEILEKVTETGGTDSYKTQIAAYLLELESEFFGFTVSGTTKTFREGGYYGAPNANKEMYNLYSRMREAYSYNLSKGYINGTTYDSIDRIVYNVVGSSYGTLYNYVASGKSDGYWKYFNNTNLKTYMSFVEKAQTAISSYTGAMKAVYEQHILVESLSPRFMICVAGDSSNSNYGFKNGYNGTNITTMRTNLKADFASLGITYYGEHYLLSDLYDKWGI